MEIERNVIKKVLAVTVVSFHKIGDYCVTVL